MVHWWFSIFRPDLTSWRLNSSAKFDILTHQLKNSVLQKSIRFQIWLRYWSDDLEWPKSDFKYHQVALGNHRLASWKESLEKSNGMFNDNNFQLLDFSNHSFQLHTMQPLSSNIDHFWSTKSLSPETGTFGSWTPVSGRSLNQIGLT